MVFVDAHEQYGRDCRPRPHGMHLMLLQLRSMLTLLFRQTKYSTRMQIVDKSTTGNRNLSARKDPFSGNLQILAS